MATFRLVFISILMLSTGWAAQNFLPVSVCPRDKNTWKFESDRKNCQGDTPDYLCAAIENQVGNFGEICTKFGLTPDYKCAVLNEQTHNLDSVDCKAPSGCPSQPYIPSVLWQYQICYEDFYGTTTSLAPTTTQDITSATTNSGNKTLWNGPKDGGSGTGVGVAVAVVIILIIVVVVMVVFYVRNQFGFKDKVQQRITGIYMHRCYLTKCFEHGDENSATAENGEAQSTQVPLLEEDVRHVQENESNSDTNVEPPKKKIEELKELMKYLVHILKQELRVNDLKEKVVIHSKSVNEHFSEQLIKDLQSLKDINDYSQLDTSLVFAMLRNFCENIKPPSRGWDYEPPDDETHVGADIERIRSMWNKYCDNDSQFKHLEDVYKRMKQKYGTVAVQGDDGIMKSSSKDEENTEGSELMKEKINSIKLNPDCTVEKGIVITENVTTALRLLKSRNVVILKGVIGCGKTHALKAIQNHFQGKDWETEWVDSEILQEEISTNGPTIILCDNLFGQFGNCVFSQTDVAKIEKTLGAIEGAGDNIKAVIGIHTHVFDEVNKSLKLYLINKKNIIVDMDKLSEAESLLIFKEQLKQGHCSKMDSDCWFKTVGFQSVLDKLSKNQGHIGGPFLSLMYCNQHELFSDESFSVNPVQTLIQYFRRMRQDSRTLYYCLVYLMCVQEHNFEGELEEVAGMISIDITNNTLENIVSQSGFTCIQGEDKEKRETLAHDMLTIVVFKSAAETIETFLPVAQKCKVDIIIQLLRPANGTYGNLYCEFNGAANKNYKFRDCGKFCVFQLVRKYAQEGQVHHPFKSEEIFKEKCKRYVENEPTVQKK
ncbi:uncharacterized protein LOC128187594 [Crassostrea angulata]|uniref:uncharacterized protein LOC128187594 n=1 Tax=Magallana angulata TaxID=2784310 RepID=UPI0022B17C45|nr:uncharacterized protein LOC128187594 [Crassostrea angulata]